METHGRFFSFNCQKLQSPLCARTCVCVCVCVCEARQCTKVLIRTSDPFYYSSYARHLKLNNYLFLSLSPSSGAFLTLAKGIASAASAVKDARLRLHPQVRVQPEAAAWLLLRLLLDRRRREQERQLLLIGLRNKKAAQKR